MKILSFCFLLLALLPACRTAPPVAARVRPEPLGPAPMMTAPSYEARRLANGLALQVVSKRDLPLVNVTLVIRGGSAADPADLPGLTGFLGELLRAGTAEREEVDLAIEEQGGHLSIRVEQDSTSLSVTVLSRHLAPILDILADVVKGSRFAAPDIERVRALRRSALYAEGDDPEALASRLARKVLFGDHPYGHSSLGTEAALARIDRDALVAYARRHLRPRAATLLVVGDVELEAAYAAASEAFRAWRGDDGEAPPPEALVPEERRLLFVPRAGAAQSQLWVTGLGIARRDPDLYAVVVLNEILGGMFNSRLNTRLREELGYTYGAYSYFDTARAPGAFVIGAAVQSDATADSLRVILHELTALAARAPSEEELKRAKEGFALSLPSRFQTVGGIARTMSSLFVYDLEPDFYRELPWRVLAVGAAEVLRVAKKYLRPQEVSVVVVGDDVAVEELEALGLGVFERLDQAGS